MCPAERTGEEPPEETNEEPPGADPLEHFAIDLARRQAVERGEEEADVDEAFIARALAESRRMRAETGKSQQKRAANFASVAGRHGEHGMHALHQAMEEHAAEVLTPDQRAATGVGEERPTPAE